METKLQLGGVTFHHAAALRFGAAAVTAGVIAHLPMYLLAHGLPRLTATRRMQQFNADPVKIGNSK